MPNATSFAEALGMMMGRGSTSGTPINGDLPNEIAVSSTPFRNSLREGIVRRGPFSIGHTGGNILGAIGDALLIGAGRDPVYAPRLHRARSAEALIDYTQDPQRAIDQYSQVDPEKAMILADRLAERQSVGAYRNSQIQANNDEYENRTHGVALGLLGAATPSTYPAIRQRISDYYQSRGITPLFDLPEQYDEEAVQSFARGGIPVAKQAKLAEDRRYHDAVIGQDRMEEAGRTQRNREDNATSTANNNADNVTSRANNTATNDTRRATSSTIARPNIRFGRRADGTRYVIQ